MDDWKGRLEAAEVKSLPQSSGFAGKCASC
jgi:hypothetical protein